ncbi:unnamed protein product [Polarella glacialis]|uniref:SET domain-containing protein n=1 Tax=Polarella glacialis TaxID=89957 RepID=A0A813KV60_POLGL|nr:unnamed protein product [Polarella glacialis]
MSLQGASAGGSDKFQAAQRLAIFQAYFSQLRHGLQHIPGGGTEAFTACLSARNVGHQENESLVASVLASNGRKTEWWDPWTLLLDESKAQGGIWLGASLFNHSCLGNVVISYCPRGDGSLGILVARAASPIAEGEELCHTYVYPFETVDERRGRLQRSYGFCCDCRRCAIEAPFAKAAIGLADNLELGVKSFSELRSRGGHPKAMASVASELRASLVLVDKAQRSIEGEADSQILWRSQFVWGDHALAMASEHAGMFQEATGAYRRCVELIAAAAPGSGYELKYRISVLFRLTFLFYCC